METIHYYATHQSKDNTQEYNFYCETEKIEKNNRMRIGFGC